MPCQVALPLSGEAESGTRLSWETLGERDPFPSWSRYLRTEIEKHSGRKNTLGYQRCGPAFISNTFKQRQFLTSDVQGPPDILCFLSRKSGWGRDQNWEEGEGLGNKEGLSDESVTEASLCLLAWRATEPVYWMKPRCGEGSRVYWKAPSKEYKQPMIRGPQVSHGFQKGL